MRNVNRPASACTAAALTALTITLTDTACHGQIWTNNGNGDAEAQRDRARAAAVATARGQVQRAQQLLTVAQQRVQANWQANPQYLLAVKEQEDARRAFGAERDRVVEKLKGDYRFSELKDAESDAVGDLRQAQERTNATQPDAQPGTTNPPAPSPEQIAAAQEKLNRKVQVRKAVDDAVAADPDAAKAKDRLDKANASLQAMSLQLKAALLNDPEYKSALDQLTQARAQVTAAAASNP